MEKKTLPSALEERPLSEDQASKMEEPRVEVIVETRKEEAIFSPSGEGEPITRRACFLKPCIGGPSSSSPEASAPCLSPSFDPKKWPFSVHWKEPIRGWKLWVEKMQTLHEDTWRRAGIYEAIMSSTCKIVKDGDLVVGMAERWCPATKSFVFPWGEATVTLEDMVIIGGYSVLGCPVFSPLETEEMVAVQELLVETRLKMMRSSSARRATQCSWVSEFKDGGSEIEHEAFLALWLSRYVLASIKATYDVILEKSFPIAVLLASGTRVALAPSVLARIYNDLTLLKDKIVALTASECNEEEDGDDFAVTVRLPFQLVQVWGWERFVDLQPEPNAIRSNEALLAKWDKVTPIVKEGNLRLLLDSAKGKFTWRPYANSVFHRSLPKYAELGDQSVLCSDLDEDLLTFARFLRVSELVGMGCIEQYLPHRVAMQFGFDQDVPCSVSQCDRSPEVAWKCYNHSEKELMCYLPSCLDGAGVTARYIEWWRSSVEVHQSKFVRKKKTANSFVSSFNTTSGIMKAWRAGNSAKQDANGGAKRVSSYAITPEITKEWRAASFAKRSKVPVSNTSMEMKESSKVAGSSRKHSENIPSEDRREEDAQVLPFSPGLLRKKSSDDDAGMQNENIPTPPRKTREDSSFKLERKKSLVRILLASQNLAKRKRLENSKFDARAAARKIARTSAVVSKYKELKEIHECCVPPGFHSKDVPGQNPSVRCSPSEARELPEAGQPTSPQCSGKHSSSSTHDANAEVSKAASAIDIIDLDNIIDLEENTEEILEEDKMSSSNSVGRSSEARTESEVNADQQLPDNIDILGPELAARLRSLKAGFNWLIAEKMQQQH